MHILLLGAVASKLMFSLYTVMFALTVLHVVKQNSTIQPNQHISACINCVAPSQGWANASLLPRGRRSSDDKRQRGKNNPGCGGFRETQVTQTGKEEKEERTGERREKSTETQRKCEGDFIYCHTQNSSLHLIHPLSAVWCRGTSCQPRALTGYTVHELVFGKTWVINAYLGFIDFLPLYLQATKHNLHKRKRCRLHHFCLSPTL